MQPSQVPLLIARHHLGAPQRIVNGALSQTTKEASRVDARSSPNLGRLSRCGTCAVVPFAALYGARGRSRRLPSDTTRSTKLYFDNPSHEWKRSTIALYNRGRKSLPYDTLPRHCTSSTPRCETCSGHAMRRARAAVTPRPSDHGASSARSPPPKRRGRG